MTKQTSQSGHTSPTGPISRRTALRRALAAIFCGLFLTLALAWAHPLLQQFLPTPRTRGPGGDWIPITLAVPGKGHGGITTTPLFTFSALWSTGGGSTHISRQEWLDHGVPQWAATPDDYRSGSFAYTYGSGEMTSSAYTYGYGWPARCLLFINASPSSSKLTKTPLAYFPTTPYWRGLFIDVLIWSAVAACLLSLFSAATNWRRTRASLRRGLCPKCSYSLGGLTTPVGTIPRCPECGTPVTTSRPTIPT